MSIILLRVEAYLDIARTHGHHTFEERANAAGLGVATIHRIVNGGPAGSSAVAALCSTYGVGFDDLFVLSEAKAKPRTSTTTAKVAA